VARVTFSDSDSVPVTEFLNPNPAISKIWESDSCSDSSYNRGNRNVPMVLLRAVSVALHTPQLGWPTLSQGPKIQSHHNLSPKKASSSQTEIWNTRTQWSWEALWKKSAYTLVLWAHLKGRYLHIATAVGEPFGSNVANLYNTVAVESLWNQGRPTLHITVALGAPFESVVILLTHYICYCGPF